MIPRHEEDTSDSGSFVRWHWVLVAVPFALAVLGVVAVWAGWLP